MELVHKGVLRKFDALKGEVINGKKLIKGESKEKRVPADKYVEGEHILHDLIRGFYKPAGQPYLLSYQATESIENYGKQIVWNEIGESFREIKMHPPSGEKDNRKKSDISAARYNLEHGIPIGILYKVKKGVNKILGLGMIKSEREDGVFIVKPFSYNELEKKAILFELENDEEVDTEVLRKVVTRLGQGKFKKKLLSQSHKCAICGLDASAFLIASHIKAWKDSNSQERLDLNNGLLLCPNHDKLFDEGYISFDKDGHIIISDLVSDEMKEKMYISTDSTIQVREGMEEYLVWHKEHYLKK